MPMFGGIGSALDLCELPTLGGVAVVAREASLPCRASPVEVSGEETKSLQSAVFLW